MPTQVCTIPYIRSEINVFILFKALGVVSDKDICERIVYTFNDKMMMQVSTERCG